jgi:voltage-gated potassium channel Kch
LAKIGRLYKLIKLTKLLRVLKIVKERSKLLKYVREVVKLGYGFERLVFMTLIFFLLTHVIGCLWVFFASFADDYENTWMEAGDYVGIPPSKLYLQSFYWTVTTITTVGYGDVSVTTNLEKIFCIVLMVIGVVGFGLLSGALTNILQNYDVQNSQFQEKVVVLNRLYKEHYLPLNLYLRLK